MANSWIQGPSCDDLPLAFDWILLTALYYYGYYSPLESQHFPLTFSAYKIHNLQGRQTPVTELPSQEEIL